MGEDFNLDLFLNNLWQRENDAGFKGIEGKGGYHGGKYYFYKTANNNEDIGPGFDKAKQSAAFLKRAKDGFTREELNSMVKERALNELPYFRKRIIKEGGDPSKVSDAVYNGLLDMYWQLGNGLYKDYPKFWKAVASGDYEKMQAESKTYYAKGDSTSQNKTLDEGRWNFRKKNYFQKPERRQFPEPEIPPIYEQPNSTRVNRLEFQPSYEKVYHPMNPILKNFWTLWGQMPYKAYGGNLFETGGYGGGHFAGAGKTSRWGKQHTYQGVDNFNQAFDNAVRDNLETFWFDGREYNTKKENNPVREYNNRWVGQGRRENPGSAVRGYDHQRGPLGGALSLVPTVTDTYDPHRNGVPTLELIDHTGDMRNQQLVPIPGTGLFYPSYLPMDYPTEWYQKNKKSEGGKIQRHKTWNELSLNEKSDMMKVAVKNGITNLKDIRQKYNEFALGGDLSDQEYYKKMEEVADKNYKKWGFSNSDEALLHALNDNTYDYRTFYNDNPQSNANADTHWPDAYKTVWHPTFSNQSIYSGKKSQYNPLGLVGGRWAETEDDVFIPQGWQLLK